MVRNLGELGINLQKIVKRLMANQDLLKLLYYTDKDPLSGADITEQKIKDEIFEELIKVVPRVSPKKDDARSIVALRIINGRTNSSNTEFRNLSLSIEVFVPLTQWIIKNESLRPFCIMGEILESLNNKNVNGLGKIIGGDFSLSFLTDEMSCYEMTFSIVEYE